MNNTDIPKLAKECGAHIYYETATDVDTEIAFTGMQVKYFATALTEPLEARVAELEAAQYAITNKSDKENK